jgi:nucleoid DNA-binding protein
VNKSELVKSLAEKAEITQKDAAKALDATVEVIQTALANGDKVQIIGFGSFEVRDRKERKVISPATGVMGHNQVYLFLPGQIQNLKVQIQAYKHPVNRLTAGS